MNTQNTKFTSIFSRFPSFFKPRKKPAFVYRPDPKAPGQSFMELVGLANDYDDDGTADTLDDSSLSEKEKIRQFAVIINKGIAGDSPTQPECFECDFPHLSMCGQLFHPDVSAKPQWHNWLPVGEEPTPALFDSEVRS